MSYKITITKIETKKVIKEGEYQVIGERIWTERELDEAKRIKARIGLSEEKFLEKNPFKEVRGYAPDFESSEEIEIKVLEQTVENLDLSAVIKAVNGI